MRRRRAPVLLAIALAVLSPPAIAAQVSGPADLGVPTPRMLAESVHTWDPSGHVTRIESTRTDGDERVISLDSDILFAFGRADLSPAAGQRIDDLVSRVPRGAGVGVTGHTDDVGGDGVNQVLSERRARAVAAAVRGARPDLRLSVRGRGETEPVRPNTSGEGREANRRVEVRYRG